MSMQPLDESRYDEWDRFVARTKGTIFHTAWWYKAWGVEFDVYARRDKDGEIDAGMPVYISNYKQMPKVFGIKGLTKPPLTLVNSPLFLDSLKTGRCNRYAHVKRETLSALSSLPRVDFYDIFLHSFQQDLMPYIWNGFDTHVYYTYVIPAGEAGAWRSNMAAGARHNLSAAHKEARALGCTLETDADVNEIMPLIFETAAANGVPMKRVPGRMPKWWGAVREKGAGMTYVLRDRLGKALCGTVAVWDAHAAYYMMGGMRGDARKGHLNMLLFERMITDSFDLGLDFDFEGSTLRGVEKFFRGWGGELRPCFRVTKSPSILAYIGLKGYKYLKFHRNRRWVEQGG